MTGKVAVISAVNFSEGGPLTVLRDCTDAACNVLGPEWEIYVLVHSKHLISASRAIALEFPKSKGSWRTRLVLEWVHFDRLSKELKPAIWVSLHDITPRVTADRKVVYCHNPAPFYRPRMRDTYLEPSLLLFRYLYKFLYRINIHSNTHVVVQQEWIRGHFRKLFRHRSVIVAHPEVPARDDPPPLRKPKSKTVFFFPALARVFKNFEVLCQAVEAMPAEIRERMELRLTVDGTENRYARWLVRQFGSLPGIRFIGRQDRTQMNRQYQECDAVLFPSVLETWGLPISEAKCMNKPLLVADLPYAHETVGKYDRVSFLSAESELAWRQAMSEIVLGTWQPQGHPIFLPHEPFAADWVSLWSLLTAGL